MEDKKVYPCIAVHLPCITVHYRALPCGAVHCRGIAVWYHISGLHGNARHFQIGDFLGNEMARKEWEAAAVKCIPSGWIGEVCLSVDGVRSKAG